ncbi:ATP-binding cassette domain-containing protein, partial [Streptomyces sp. AC555_RSS877]|uniref:ATP-binding cassette domain-containing protein n=1 Tax=Streptomyces sp. AC555_RSS877 TaxID=2823688 RepID=UPI0035AC0C02
MGQPRGDPEVTHPMTTTHDATPEDTLARDTEAQDDAPVVELKATGKSYGNVRALHSVDLQVRPGRVTCVLGDNGAGKSTLIKIISGLHQHTEGDFLVDGT